MSKFWRDQGPNRWRRIPWGLAVSAVPALLVAVFYSIKGGGIVLAVLGVTVLFVEARNFVLLSASLALAVLASVAVIWFGLPDLHYRPFEVYRLADRYEPNIDTTMDSPFGDLVATGGPAAAHLAQPRRIRLVTDAAGYRNDGPLTPSSLVLAGDSFIAGIGSDQPDILGARIEARTGRPVYALGFPGSLHLYARMLGEVGRPAHVFAFEGNDFTQGDCEVTNRPPSRLSDRLRRPYLLLRKTVGYRRRMTRAFRAWKRGTPDAQRFPVEIHRVGGEEMLFSAHYTPITRRQSFTFDACFAQSLAPVKHLMESLVFIPTKYRVYAPLFDQAPPGGPLPDAQLQALRRLGRTLGVPVHDLTPALQEAAAAGLKDGTLVYWRDDTHWNGRGMDVAARAFICLALDAKACGPGQ